MSFLLEDPVRLRLPEVSGLRQDQLKTRLTYTDEKIGFEIRRHKKTGIYRFPTAESFQAELERLQRLQKVCLLFRDSQGPWTYSGLEGAVRDTLNVYGQTLRNFTYPSPHPLPWDKDPGKTPYPYQEAAAAKLLEARHARVEMGTGLGKSFIIAMLLKRLGLKSLVMAPGTQIAEQLYEDFQKWFGPKRVGAFFDGKKKPDKLITVGNAQSLTRVVPGTKEFKALSETQVFIADESHQCPAKTLANVCFGTASRAPYRFFFSATQMRNDGADLLLDGITGPTVYEMTVREGVDGGYLTRPKFGMLSVPSHGTFDSDDPMRMTRHHLYYNPRVIESVGRLANSAARAGMPTLILVEEVEQFTKLLPYLRFPVRFAHGPLAENKAKVPPEFWESDPSEQVKAFDRGEFPILVGTSCISTGTDIRSVQFLVYWQGGQSEIQVRQAVGRGTRLFPGKNCCHVVDFHVLSPCGSRTHWDNDGERRWGLGTHALERMRIYEDIFGPVVESEAP